MRDLGLRFGALNFVVDHEGRYWFLEVNPCGQWDWNQAATGLPISDAIADELPAMETEFQRSGQEAAFRTRPV
ncbi:hypothetical protein [Streptosporangium sp. NBC_01469]|uniref:hypothetical protein n=1 Tax=Streptosporangium sp. NBC_01469 TaxID=2903898 RepID=UPI002E288FBA|nr:hypothetical protein [Streptosporangium sp. NBC_01469]